MSVHLEFTITDTGAKQLFSRMSNADFFTLKDEIGQALVAEVQERFDSSQAPDGTPWIESQRAIEEGGKTLVDENILLSGITHQVLNNSVLMGTPEIYGRIQHLGGFAGRNHSVELPARTIFGFETAQQARVDEVWLGWLEDYSS